MAGSLKAWKRWTSRRRRHCWKTDGQGIGLGQLCRGFAKADSISCRHDFKASADIVTGVLGEATIRELDIGMTGSVVGPGDPDYETARFVWNRAIDKRPALIVRAASTEDVARAVAFARSEGRPIAVRGGGHSIAGFSTCDDGIVIDLAQLNDVQVDVESRRAFAGGGTTWKTFDAATQQHGLATPGGLVSSTGIGGFALGGAIGNLVRRCGLACDNLLSAELITADGSVVHASESQNSELFWALRGGGGNFGVVTRFEFALHPVGPLVLGGVIFYPGEQAAQVVNGWRDLLEGMPDELSTLVNLTTAPPAPFLPESWHFKKVMAVAACWAGDPAEGEDVVKPLRALGTPITDLLGPMAYLDLQQLVDPLWEAGAANYFTSAFLDRLPDEAINTLTDYHRSSADRPVQAELHIHHLAGAVARVPAGNTAFTERRSPFLVNCAARTPDPADLPSHVAWARAARNAMASYGKGEMYVNFTGEGAQDNVRASYPSDIYARLQAVKDQYDPFNVFRLNLNIPPTK
jgi:FAD/FMN-containing dehydrogenase